MVDPVASVVGLLIGLLIAVLMIAAVWKLFTKAGKPGWAAIVPFYNTWVLVEVAKLSPLWFVLTFIPLANVVAIIVIYHGISKAFGKGVGTTILMLLFPYVMLPYLAFSRDVVYGGGAQDNFAAPMTPPTSPTPQGPFPPTTGTPPTPPPITPAV